MSVACLLLSALCLFVDCDIMHLDLRETLWSGQRVRDPHPAIYEVPYPFVGMDSLSVSDEDERCRVHVLKFASAPLSYLEHLRFVRRIIATAAATCRPPREIRGWHFGSLRLMHIRSEWLDDPCSVRSVDDLDYYHEGRGHVRWKDPVNLEGADLSELVFFDRLGGRSIELEGPLDPKLPGGPRADVFFSGIFDWTEEHQKEFEAQGARNVQYKPEIATLKFSLGDGTCPAPSWHD